MQIRSTNLSIDPIPDMRNMYAIISSVESRRVVSCSDSSTSYWSQSYVVNFNVGNRGNAQRLQISGNFSRPSNLTGSNNSGNRMPSSHPTLVCEHCGFKSHTIDRCFKLIGYPAALKKECVNQHLTYTDKYLVNVIDISKLRIKVSHPNGIEAHITKDGNMILTKHLTIYDLLVVLEYCVSLMFVHKVARDSKFSDCFDESNCYVLPQDLREMKFLRIGRQKCGLYYFNGNQGTNLGCKNSRFTCNLSKDIWHCRLGHPSDQVLSALKNDITFEKDNEVKACDICQKAKQTSEPIPLSDHSSTSLGELVHLDLWGLYKMASREWFKYFLTIVNDYSRAVWVYLLKSKDEIVFLGAECNDKFSSRLEKCKFFEKVFPFNQGLNHTNFFNVANMIWGIFVGSNGSVDEDEMAATFEEHLSNSKGIQENSHSPIAAK
ncbi:ribonuclease H-like domain-containing protein [Tanacetum coccineum]